MFRIDERYELDIPVLLPEDGAKRHWVVEQCFNHPLWQIRVLSPLKDGDRASQYWTRLLVSRAEDALAVLLGEAWDSSEAMLIVPDYMNGGQSPVLAHCLAIWECEDVRASGRKAWLIQTDQGDLMDPHHGSLKAEFKRVALKWEARSEKSHRPHTG